MYICQAIALAVFHRCVWVQSLTALASHVTPAKVPADRSPFNRNRTKLSAAMASNTLSSLPPEIVANVMTHLPIPALLALGATSAYFHALQATALTSLQLGIFPSRLDGVLANFSSQTAHDPARSINLRLPSNTFHAKDSIITAQNTRASAVLEQHGDTLRDVELALWDLQASTAKTLTSLRRLRSLAIRLDHPHTSHRSISRKFWHQSPGSTMWNHLYGSRGGASPARPALGGKLQRLTLERAGVTDYQLRRILEENPQLTELRLRKCRTLTCEFFDWLAHSETAKRLEVLHFEQSWEESIDGEVLESIGEMPCLRELSLSGCGWITNAEVEAWSKGRAIDVTLPQRVEKNVVKVDVDPAYK